MVSSHGVLNVDIAVERTVAGNVRAVFIDLNPGLHQSTPGHSLQCVAAPIVINRDCQIVNIFLVVVVQVYCSYCFLSHCMQISRVYYRALYIPVHLSYMIYASWALPSSRKHRLKRVVKKSESQAGCRLFTKPLCPSLLRTRLANRCKKPFKSEDKSPHSTNNQQPTRHINEASFFKSPL
jgi:hypothetical protein